MKIEFAKWHQVDDIIALSDITHKEHHDRMPDDFISPVQQSLLGPAIRGQFKKRLFGGYKPNNTILVCTDNYKVLGHLFFIRIETPMKGISYLIADITVCPENRHSGIGQKLLQALQKEADKNSVRTIRADVWTGNIASEKLFEKNDFLIVNKSYSLHNPNAPTDTPARNISHLKWLQRLHPIFLYSGTIIIVWFIMYLNR